jgi:hypothetical protein
MKLPAPPRHLVATTLAVLEAMAKSEKLSDAVRATLDDLRREWLRHYSELDKGEKKDNGTA